MLNWLPYIGLSLLFLNWTPPSVWAQEPPVAVAPVVWDDQPETASTAPSLVRTDGCAVCCDPCCEPCGPAGRVWFTGEVLAWWMRGSWTPPLVTGSAPGTPLEDAGILGRPGTAILFGDERINSAVRGGFRVGMGVWLNREQTWGLEGSFFVLSRQEDGFVANGLGGQILARPFFDVEANAADSALVSFPGLVSGAVAVSSYSELLGSDFSVRRRLSCSSDCCGGRRIDLVAGFRYLRLAEQLDIYENIQTLDGDQQVPAGTRFLISDRFTTRNEFYGGQIGVMAETWQGRWFASFRGVIGLGTNRQSAQLEGSTTVIVPDLGPVTFPGGLLVQPSNLGQFNRSQFAVVPELSFQVGCHLTDNLRVFLGYNLIWWTNVIRPGDLVDLAVDPSQVVARPAFGWNTSDAWIQGISGGVQIRF